MKSFLYSISAVLHIYLFVSSHQAFAQQEDGEDHVLTARDIMEKHEHVLWDSYDSYFQNVKLITCKYKTADGGMRCAEKPRVSLLEGILKYSGKDDRDIQTMAIVYEPSRDKGIGMLNYDYYDPNTDTDNWIYLPALGKVKRIISNSEDNDDTTNFIGSEYSMEDMTRRKISHYAYKIIGEETFNGRPSWIIESVTNPDRLRKTRYSKIVTWVDKERYLFLRENLYNHNDEFYKQRTYMDYEEVDGVWVAKRASMDNLLKRRISFFNVLDIAYDVEITDEFLTHRTFSDFAYRERNLEKFRKHWK